MAAPSRSRSRSPVLENDAIQPAEPAPAPADIGAGAAPASVPRSVGRMIYDYFMRALAQQPPHIQDPKRKQTKQTQATSLVYRLRTERRIQHGDR